jgi:dUTP pyrophosphatase
MSKAPFFIKKLNSLAFIPKKGSEKAAGYDLFSIEDIIIPAQGKNLVKTGLAFSVPSGNYARIGKENNFIKNILFLRQYDVKSLHKNFFFNFFPKAPRSGLAWKNFIDVGAGVIDEDYRGEGIKLS